MGPSSSDTRPFWPFCVSYTILLGVFVSVQEQPLIRAAVLTTYCGDFFHGVPTTVECRHDTSTQAVSQAQCISSSKGLYVMNGSHTLGTSNCKTASELGLTKCTVYNITKNHRNYPKCCCGPTSYGYIYKVTFIPHRMYDQGINITCVLDCQRKYQQPLEVSKTEDGICKSKSVGCRIPTYGPRCESQCGRCINGSNCDWDTGHCDECEPGFQMPFCKNCRPGLVPPDCQVCNQSGFQPFNCMECKPGFRLPDCKQCKTGFRPPNCTECETGLVFPDCTRCVQPHFLPPNCMECQPGRQYPGCVYCKPGFLPPNCTECHPGLQYPECEHCIKPGFLPPKCTECHPGVQFPECEHCVKPGFLPPNCTECQPGLQYPECEHCIKPGFLPPNCTECLQGLEGFDCAGNHTSASPKTSGLSTAEKVGAITAAVAGSAILLGAGFQLVGMQNWCQNLTDAVEFTQCVVDTAADVEKGQEGDVTDSSEVNEEGTDDQNSQDSAL